MADICQKMDNGTPVTLNLGSGTEASDNPEAQAFADLADNVVKAVDARNSMLPPSTVVEVH